MLGNLKLSNGQCYLNPSTTTQPRDEIYRTDVINLTDMSLSLLEYVNIIKSEYWSNFGPNLTITAPSDGACAVLGTGQSLETFTRKNNWEIHLSSVPVLTDILRLTPDKFYIPSQSKNVLLNFTQFQSLTSHLNIILSLDDQGPPQLSIFKSEDSGSLILETFDIGKANACAMSSLGQNILHSFENTLQLVKDSWQRLQKLLHFFGADSIVRQLESCLGIQSATLMNILNSPANSFNFCLQNLGNTSTHRVVRQTSLLSFLLGEGKTISAIENSLKDSIVHFNTNFRKIALFDSQVLDSFNNLEQDIQSLANLELGLQDQLSELSRHTRLTHLRLEFAILKIQHESALFRLFTESPLGKNMDLLERALLSSNICSLDLCESAISHQIIGSSIHIHREIVVLEPVRKFLISCQAKTALLVPHIHNSLAELTVSGQFLIDSQLYSQKDLENSTCVNLQLHVIPETEKLLESFHHFTNHSSFYIQCLAPVSFMLNDQHVQCELLDFFPLPENFVLIFEGKSLRSQKLIQETHKSKTSWMQDYVFSNIDSHQIPENPPFTMLHPQLEAFLFDEAGEIRVDNVSYTGTVITILIFTICGCCFWKVECFRKFVFAKGELLKNQVYTLFTTQEFRLKREKKGLDKQLDKSFAELKRMEQVIARKTELKRKLPDASSDKIASAPSGPSSSGTSRKPSAPPKHQVMADVHQEPPVASSSKRSSRSVSALDKH